MPEFLTCRDTLVEAARRHGLRLVRWTGFYEYEAEMKKIKANRMLFERMVRTKPSVQEQALSGLYSVFIFEKM